ncbi:MAG TPA: AMP-binding protein [Chloroflexia bacterium]|nr:AMP-binding protein [Chloroflexia bacterium]
MIEVPFAQLRLVASTAFGKPFALWSLHRLIKSLKATRQVFGHAAPQSEAAAALNGPSLNPQMQTEMQLSRFRKLARQAASQTPYYSDLFNRLGLDPTKLTSEDLQKIPFTEKQTVRENPDAFVVRQGRPFLRAMTTGTTGRPTCISFSAHELKVYAALAAISYLLSGTISSADIVQISTGSRGTLGNLTLAGGCGLVGAEVYLAGIVDPVLALSLLSENRRIPGKKARTSVLYTYPSYLGQLVEAARKEGLGPQDFGLEKIIIGGEPVSQGLKRRAETVFGQVSWLEGYGMTEIWPLGGTICPEGHLHFDPLQGLVEVYNPLTGRLAQPGETGNLVVTPFPPYRETTLLLRYNTRDAVRVLDQNPGCVLAHWPATGPLLGKQDLAIACSQGYIYPRQIVEALEAIEEVPLPARFSLQPGRSGVVVQVALNSNALLTTGYLSGKIAASLIEQGIPLEDLQLVANPHELKQPFPWRADLREYSFQEKSPEEALVNPHEGLSAILSFL